MLIAITRQVSPSIVDCELTHLPRLAIDHSLAVGQHGRYQAALASLGCHVVSLPSEPSLPDSVFVEDAAVVLDEVAVLTRPGAKSRRPEVELLAGPLGQQRELVRIMPPGRLEGGDVLRVGRSIYVGLSSRTNRTGIDQLTEVAQRLGYQVQAVPVQGCLHLKSAVTQVGPEMLLMNPAWVPAQLWGRMDRLHVAVDEPYAANGLLIAGALIYPTTFPRTQAMLDDRGVRVMAVDVSELQKAEGAVTCCSLVFEGKRAPG
jgi:dimethylargininase